MLRIRLSAIADDLFLKVVDTISSQVEGRYRLIIAATGFGIIGAAAIDAAIAPSPAKNDRREIIPSLPHCPLDIRDTLAL